MIDIKLIVKNSDLIAGEYIVVASGILNALGIRESEDIDLVVTPDLYKKLKQNGWQEVDKGGYKVLLSGPFEAGMCWDSVNEIPNLADLLKDVVYFDDIPYVNLARVKKWKTKMARPKDIRDLQLIDKYLKNTSSGQAQS